MTKRKQLGNFFVQKRSIVPNIITMSNLTMGFFAIIFASSRNPNGLFYAGVLVFLGSIFDALDGAVARALKVESSVGVQLDSLADGIAYGVAPAVIAYQAYLAHIPNFGLGFSIGMLIAPIYTICAIYRLARFNISEDEHNGFSGLPSPAAGLFVATIPTLSQTNMIYFGQLNVNLPIYVFVPLYIFVGLLMVSKVDYGKLFADIYKKGKAVLVITIIILGITLFIFKMWAIFVVVCIYIASGLVLYLCRAIFRK